MKNLSAAEILATSPRSTFTNALRYPFGGPRF